MAMSKSKADPAKDHLQSPVPGKAEQPVDTVGPQQKPGEVGGPKGPEPTRYGDWEVDGRCTDF